MNETIILYDDPGAVTQETKTLYRSMNGNYFLTEDSARKDSMTHKSCEICGSMMKKNSYCHPCQDRRNQEWYRKLPFMEWDGKTPLYDHNTDTYFMDADSLDDFIAEALEDDIEWSPDSMQLVICQANYPRQLDFELWCDSMPEDGDERLFDSEVIIKLNELNQLLSKHKPLSYSPGKIRTVYDYKPENDPNVQ